MNSVFGHNDLGQEQLIADFKVVIDDAEALLKATAAAAGAAAGSLIGPLGAAGGAVVGA